MRPSWIQRLTGRKAWTLMVLLGAAMIGFQYFLLSKRPDGARTASSPSLSLPLPEFALTERNGKAVKKADLLGAPWVANFIFTSCPGPCLDMTRAMQRLQTEVLPEFPEVRLVSFSVDPETDTPQVLGTFAASYQADPERWLFLTGPTDAIETLCQKGFNLALAEAPETDRPRVGRFIHSTKFVVVDAEGRIRGYVDGLAADAPAQIKSHLRALKP